MRKENWKGRQLSGWLERMRNTFMRLCGGQIRRSDAFTSARMTLPGLPVTAELQGQAMAVRRFALPKQRELPGLPAITAPAKQRRTFAERKRDAKMMRKGAADGPRGRSCIRRALLGGESAVRQIAPFRLRGLAGAHPNHAANSGATYGLRGLMGAHPNHAANSGATYGLRGLMGAHPNHAANSGATYGLRGLAGAHPNASNSDVTYGLRGLSAVHQVLPHGKSAVRRLALSSMMRQTSLLRLRMPDAQATNGLRGLAGAHPAPVGSFMAVAAQSRPMAAQLSPWSAPSALPPRIPSPPSGGGPIADASAQVQVVVTNNCKIETPVDYQTVWDKLEDALRESLNVVAAGG